MEKTAQQMIEMIGEAQDLLAHTTGSDASGNSDRVFKNLQKVREFLRSNVSSLPSDSEKAARERSRIRAMDFLKWYEHSDYRNTPKTVSELYIIFNTLNPE